MSDNERWFASDNNASVHPEIMSALERANSGHAIGYGGDPYTASATARARDHFGDNAEIYFVFNGTGANVLALDACLRPHEAVVCSDWSHLNTDECGAPERYVGCKLVTLPSQDGKISAAQLKAAIRDEHDEHRVVPRMVSISEATEFGTVYSTDEIAALVDAAHTLDLLFHIDGARLANAAAALDVPLRALTTDLGVDVLSFGGTKNGLMYGEAVVFLRPGLAGDFLYLRKQGMQLASKMRFVAAQFETLMTGDLWLRNARHANAMARRLFDRVRTFEGVEITRPVDANAVFARVASDVAEKLRGDWPFYPWDDVTGEVRWMTSWDTTEVDVDDFGDALLDLLGGAPRPTR